MRRQLWLAGLLGCLIAGRLPADEPWVKIEQPQEPVRPLLADVAAPKTVQQSGPGQLSSPVPAQTIVPYTHACQNQDLAPNPLGRVVAWFTYRPLCGEAPCEVKYTECCHPPLFSFFTCSPYNRCYQPYKCKDCDGSCTRPWFGSWFNGGFFTHFGCRDKCDSCSKADCGPKPPLTISITFPRISFTRGCDACAAPVCDQPAPCPAGEWRTADCAKNNCAPKSCNVCKDRCIPLPRPISAKACENSSAPCKPSMGCGSGFCGLFAGRFSGCGCGCGACGLGSRLFAFGPFGRQCCGGPVNSPCDLNHLPIIAPQSVQDCAVGHINQTPIVVPPATAEQLPQPKKD